MKCHLIFFIFILFSIKCAADPISENEKKNESKVIWFRTADRTGEVAKIEWLCSEETKSKILLLGKSFSGLEIPFKSKFHAATLNSVSTGDKFIIKCGDGQDFSKNSMIGVIEDPSPKTLFLIGGIGDQLSPIAQVDAYSPTQNIWIPNITSVPTPRHSSVILNHLGKIYILGGRTTTTTTGIVESFDPKSNQWTRLSDMPVPLQGHTGVSLNGYIYLFGGSTTPDMTTGTLPPFSIYRFDATSGLGSWTTITIATPLLDRINSTSCVLGGSILLSGGRNPANGTTSVIQDSYSPGLNTTTLRDEADLITGRYGQGVACSDDYKLNPKRSLAIFIGGSSQTDLIQPPVAITPLATVEIFDPVPNTIAAGPSLPVALFAPGVYYESNQDLVYVTGGSTNVNVPTSDIYILRNPGSASSVWNKLNTSMPVRRFGHGIAAY
ncbi:Kelch repeat-containing protein (plasmid) [Leptospira sp. WS92.C1]